MSGKEAESIRSEEMPKKRILSIDGGGIKGTLPASFLATIEEATGERIFDHFDLIAGTSTGGIIALGLGIGMSAKEILAFYENEGPTIFNQEIAASGFFQAKMTDILKRYSSKAKHAVLPKYNSKALKTSLNKAFGRKRLADSLTRLVIPAFDHKRREVHIFKTAHHKRFQLDYKEEIVDVALATAAAPTYLPKHQLSNGVSLLDGGIWANNPVAVAVVEGLSVLGWESKDLHVLSIGCTEEPVRIPENSGWLGLAFQLADVFVLGQSRSAMGMAKLLMGCEQGDQRLQRYQHIAPEGEYDLDSVSRIPALKGVGASMAREALPRIKAIFFDAKKEEFIPHHSS